MSVKEGNMSRCGCGNLYLPTGRSVCPPCRNVERSLKQQNLAKLRAERKAAKALARQNKRQLKKLAESHAH